MTEKGSLEKKGDAYRGSQAMDERLAVGILP